MSLSLSEVRSAVRAIGENMYAAVPKDVVIVTKQTEPYSESLKLMISTCEASGATVEVDSSGYRCGEEVLEIQFDEIFE